MLDGKEASSPAPVPEGAGTDAAGYANLLTALDTIQRTSGVYFPIPDSFSDEHLLAIRQAERLMLVPGEDRSVSWRLLEGSE